MAKTVLPKPCLMLVTEPMERARLIEVVGEAVAGGVNVVQLRDKSANGPELLDTAKALLEGIGDCILLVNGRPAVVEAAGAAGVHLPGHGLRIDTVRSIIGAERLIGRSVHSHNEAIRAAEEGADYLVAGTIYASRSHSEIRPSGAHSLRLIRKSLREYAKPANRRYALTLQGWVREEPTVDPLIAEVPLIAIGGITPENCAECIEAGAAGVAVLSGILHAKDPRAAAELYWKRLTARP